MTQELKPELLYSQETHKQIINTNNYKIVASFHRSVSSNRSVNEKTEEGNVRRMYSDRTAFYDFIRRTHIQSPAT